MIFSDHFPPKQQNRHSFQVYMEHVSRIDQMLEHKTSFNKFKKTESHLASSLTLMLRKYQSIKKRKKERKKTEEHTKDVEAK